MQINIDLNDIFRDEDGNPEESLEESIRRERVTVKYLKVEAEVRYWEAATVNGLTDADGTLIPCREGDTWSPVIDLGTGKVEGWPQDTIADLYYKVCDAGIYTLLDAERNPVKKIDGYVPSVMCPEESGYGDYIIMHIGPDGAIRNFDGSDLGAFERP